jgi:CubicO group peptidase (beta-lactamase class C family)
MNRYRSGFLFAIFLVLSLPLFGQPDPNPERIARVENGLLPPVLIKGGKTWTIAERMKFYNIPGVSIAVFADNHIQWAKGYGVMDAETGKPVTEKTLFVAGSISKPVAVTAALKLVEEKKLSLDDNINSFLTSWKLPENDLTKSNPVTLRLLTSHNAGTTVHGFPGYAPGEKIPSTQQTLDGVAPSNSPAVRVDLVPGTRWRYSGGGITIMQLAMEDVTHQPFAQIMQDKVLGPIGMTSSSYEQTLTTDHLALAASGHDGTGHVIPGKRFTYPEMAAAGLWTTPTDLAKFAIEAGLSARGTSNKVLSREMSRLMIFPRVVIEGTDSMALGLFQEMHGGAPYYGHNGADAGFVCDMIAHRTGGYGAVIMTNSDGRPMPLIREILRSIAHEYGWEGYLPTPVEVVTLSPSLLDARSGRYRLSTDNVLTVRTEDDHLMAQESAGEPYALLPISATEFVCPDREVRYTFRIEGDRATQIEASSSNGTASAARMSGASLVPIEYLLQGKTEEAVQGYRALRKANPKDDAVNENRLNNLGYQFMSRRKYDEAVAVFALNVEFFPESWNVYDSLGEAYMNKGEVRLAKENYEHSLRLNPENINGAKTLDRLQRMK